jgi:regulatory protein
MADRRPPKPAAASEARAIALRLLAIRPHATGELRQKLRQRRLRAVEIEETLDRMRQLGYLDDLVFAKALVARRAQSRGPTLIARELAAKGISRDLVQVALLSLDAGEQLAGASRLVEGVGGGDRRRATARLYRRGFSQEVISRALDADSDEP